MTSPREIHLTLSAVVSAELKSALESALAAAEIPDFREELIKIFADGGDVIATDMDVGATPATGDFTVTLKPGKRLTDFVAAFRARKGDINAV